MFEQTDWPCENSCCWIHVRRTAPGVTVYPPIAPERTCAYCDAPREPRECGEPCVDCGGLQE